MSANLPPEIAAVYRNQGCGKVSPGARLCEPQQPAVFNMPLPPDL
ncbi:MAG TPA: hypothetical protein VKM56_13710 [Verrucomicrobiae bacterium]|nr:hypothetical protein [Verrucomicrobiae bacterium]